MLRGYEQMAFDRIMARLPAEHFQLVRCEVVGTEQLPQARAAGSGGQARRERPLWMSDHFAVLAQFRVTQ